MAIITAAHRMSDFASKAEAYLTANHAGKIDASSCRIYIGANKDSGPGLDARWRLTGMARNATPLYMELPEKVLSKAMIANPDAVLGGDTFRMKQTDAANEFIGEAIQGLMDKKGKTFEEAKKAVFDSIPLVGYRNPKTHEMEAQPYIKGVTDADINSMQVPFWNISYLNKIYKQPMLQGYAKHLVTEIGVPNVWADAVSIWTQSFEGMALQVSTTLTKQLRLVHTRWFLSLSTWLQTLKLLQQTRCTVVLQETLSQTLLLAKTRNTLVSCLNSFTTL